ncbi:MAG TPA: inner membrane CreD family protein [Terriglobales bacterium]|nr:inner membrane CreD family protein [Terriglobales bacterium]
MIKRIAAISFIFVCTTIAWLALGATIFSRTYSAESHLDERVASSWGAQQTQTPPNAVYWTEKLVSEQVQENGQTFDRQVKKSVPTQVPLQGSNVNVALDLNYRQKGLLWYSTYAVNFAGAYKFQNDTDKDQSVYVQLKFPASQAIYDDLNVTVDGKPTPVRTDSSGATATVPMSAGQTVDVSFSYRSQGMEKWVYKFGDDVAQVRDFSLTMRTNFDDVDFPPDTLSPTSKRPTPNGWELTWKYSNLLSGLQIGTTMPEKLQPGPLAGQISLFAPVSLFFFFFLMFIITTLRGIDLHPMNYFFLATAFFAFHLLMAYLVDHISIHAAFVICSLVSVFLVVSYLRLVVGIRFAAVEAGIAQLIYLVLFSYAFFFKGFTGLAITIGSILTLFAVMQMTGKIKWAEKFAPKPPISPGFASGGFHD